MKKSKRISVEIKRPISIRWKLAAYLSWLIAIVLLITWLFQVFLLDRFYEKTKRHELLSSAEFLAAQINNERLDSIAYDLALECSMRVFVYRMTDTGVKLEVDVDASGGMAMYPDHDRIYALYELACENDGVYVDKITLNGYEPLHEDQNPFWKSEDSEHQKIEAENTRLMCVKKTYDEQGNLYVIVLNSALLPLNSMVRTLETQFIWIATTLIVLAVISVFVLYSYISKPLIRMNASAKQLAKGKYDTVFVGSGYLETHELADTLNYASKELSRVDMLQKELVANISHDLRTPLTMIKGYGELMRDIPGENTPENMQVIINETERLSELVSDLLDLSRLQAGATQPNYQALNLTEVVRESLTRYDALIHHRGYRIEFLADFDVWVSADRSLLLQVLYNLMNNAINYTGSDHSVFVAQIVENERVRITITDTGEGIAPEEMPLIWDRYYKVDKVHRRAMVGTGIGLSIVKGILEKHDAAYGVSSVQGEGATFWFELPVLPITEEKNNLIQSEE